MLEETEDKETRGFFCYIFVIGERWAPAYAYVLGSFVSEMRKLLATFKAEFNSSVGAGKGSKLFRTKAVAIFAFRE